jgi:hypothetical protein
VGTLQKEIQIKAVKVEDSKIGPRIGICDMTGAWYNSNKQAWIKKPGAWEALAALQRGERLDLTYEEKPWAKDGRSGVSKDIVGFEKVLRPEDEVSSAPGLPGETQAPPPQTRDDAISKLALLKAGAEMAAAQIRAGTIGDLSSPDDVAVLFARRMFAALHEAW